MGCWSPGRCFPCRGPLDSSEGPGDCRGFTRGANLAEGDDREEGDSWGSTLCLGEISRCGEELERGDVEGRGETLTLGAAVTLGAADGLGNELTLGAIDGLGDKAGTTLGDGLGVTRWIQSKIELLANAVSKLAAVRTSPALNFPSVLSDGSVAVGACPTGIGSYVSPAVGVTDFAFNCFSSFAIVTGVPLLALVSETHWTLAVSMVRRFSRICVCCFFS